MDAGESVLTCQSQVVKCVNSDKRVKEVEEKDKVNRRIIFI